MKLNSFLLAALWCSPLAGAARAAERPAAPVSLIRLIAAPEEFDGKTVTVQGFLVLGEHPEFINQFPALYLHEEDAKNLLADNSVWVAPSGQMRHDREKIDHMYVRLTGIFRAHRGPVGSSRVGTMTDVESCTPWSDPARPVGARELPAGHGKYK
jgi:hypothetical protein